MAGGSAVRGDGGAGDPFAVLLDYERRSLAHVAGVPERIEAPGLWRGIGFRLGRFRLASAIAEISEILTLPPVTPVPGTKPWLVGIANVRGNLVAMVDIKLFLLGERTPVHDFTRALVIKQPGGNVGLLIDELLGQRNFTDEMKVERDAFEGGPLMPFITAVYRYEGNLWGVFSMSRLIRTAEFLQAAA
jgi:twitching motility protein PilI